MRDKSPDRSSDCSVLTEDSYKRAKFETRDDDSMAMADAKFDVFESEAETFCEDEVVEPKVSCISLSNALSGIKNPREAVLRGV
uniref:Uncharacterized protein n=1 Tax=Trichuris muris TaxID=70415 RepID=A0A5S6QTB2_TRIMR